MVRSHVEETLRSLLQETVDIPHCDNLHRSVAELADTMTALIDKGYARRVGVSNRSANRLAELAATLPASCQWPAISSALAEPDVTLLAGNLHADRHIRAVVALIVGPLSDRLGRRPLLIGVGG